MTRDPSPNSTPRKVLAAGRTRYVQDISLERVADADSFAARAGVKSCAEVVLRGLRSSEVSGAMFINFSEPQQFSLHVRDTIGALAAGAAIAIQAARLHRKANPTLTHVQHEFEVLKQVDKLISDSFANLDIDRVLAEVLEQAQSSSGAKSAALYLPTGNRFSMRRRMVRGEEQLHPATVGSGQGVVGQAAKEAAPVVDSHGRGEAGSELGMPLWSGASLLGVLHLVHSDPNFFRKGDFGLVEALGMQGMIALRSMSALGGLESLLRALTKVASRVQTTDGDLSLWLRLVLTGITAGQGLGYTRAMVFRIGEQGRRVEGLGCVGPWDGEEAERDWEGVVRMENVSGDGGKILEDLLDRAAQHERDVMAGKPRERLDAAMRRALELSSEAMDLVREISLDPLKGIRKPSDGMLDGLWSEIGLEGFGKTNGFVILPLKTRGVDGAGGFIVADREFQGDPVAIERVDVRNLEAFAEMAALAMSSDSLRSILSNEHKRNEWERYFNRTMHTFRGALWDARSRVEQWKYSVRMGAAPPEESETINLIQDGLEKLAQIVDSLRDYSRPAIASFGRVRLRDVVHKVSEGQRDIVREECVEDPVISGDAGRLEEALRNLVTNSREALGAMPVADRPPVVVGLLVDGKSAMIEVRDEGCGFAAEIRNSIGLEWNSTKGKGRGMGLPIVKRIVEGHGGELWVDPMRAKGSSIMMKLPICKEVGGASNAKSATG